MKRLAIITDVHALHAWWPDNSPYGADMPLSDDDKAWIHTELNATAVRTTGAVRTGRGNAAVTPATGLVVQHSDHQHGSGPRRIVEYRR